MGRLTKVNSPDINETYTYDNAGNRISRTINGETEERYSYNELNMLMSIGHTAIDGSENGIRNFTYDADGNMTSDGRGIYKYDSLNRMSEAVMEDGRKLTCRYDAEGLRHETEEDGRLVRFIYSGRDVACEETDDNITRYIRGNGRLTASDSENARTYYHYASDSLGSITHVIEGNEFGNGETDGGINGRILCRYEYDAFGNAISEEETVTNRYGFAGDMHDCITDMYYLRARYYCADTGRFAQEDTYHGDGLNLYVYAGNNPVKYVDPSGHERQNGIGGVSESGSDVITDPSRLLEITKNPQDHHIIPAFRGKSKSYADFIKNLGIDVDKYTVTVSGGKGGMHMNFIHGKGKWNQKWMDYIDNNPNATAKDIYQFAGKMMDDYGLSGLEIHPYGK